MKRPDPEEIDAAAELLERLGRGHGLSNLRHGTAPGEVVADVEPGRSMFDLVAFEAAVEGRLGWRPDVTSSQAPGADPRDPVGRSTSAAMPAPAAARQELLVAQSTLEEIRRIVAADDWADVRECGPLGP